MKNLGILVFVIGILLLTVSTVTNYMADDQTDEVDSAQTAEGTDHQWGWPSMIGIGAVIAGVAIYLVDIRRKQVDRPSESKENVK